MSTAGSLVAAQSNAEQADPQWLQGKILSKVIAVVTWSFLLYPLFHQVYSAFIIKRKEGLIVCH